MKNSLLFIIFLFLPFFYSFAVNKISGTVKDADGNFALAGANVTLLKDSVVKSVTLTDRWGGFSLETEFEECVIEISYTGYDVVRMSLTSAESVDLGVIKMQESSLELNDIVVNGNSIIQKVDRQIIMPNETQRSAATDGVSLLQNLQIPRILVNPVDNSVSTLSNEGVQLRINGVKASTAEIKALSPKDIIRVEYYDQPGVRFGGAAVIDYIVKHHDSGGSLTLAATCGVTNLGIGQYYLSGKAHRGKSSFAIMSNYAPRIAYWTRSNDEIYNFSTGVVENREVGSPTKFKSNPVNVQFSYNWTNGDINMLNINLRDNMAFIPNSRSDRDSYLYQDKDTFAIHDHEKSRSISPSIDIYYQHKLPEKQRVYID